MLDRIGDREFLCSLGDSCYVDNQLNGVWNSEWERSNPFGPAGARDRERPANGGLARRAASDVSPRCAIATCRSVRGSTSA